MRALPRSTHSITTALQDIQRLQNAATRELFAAILSKEELKTMESPDELHPSPREVILCTAPGHEGLWVPSFTHWNRNDSKTALEIATGAIATLARSTTPTPTFDSAVDTLKRFGIRRAETRQQWDFLVGLCVVGHAERISLDRK